MDRDIDSDIVEYEDDIEYTDREILILYLYLTIKSNTTDKLIIYIK